MKNLKDFVNDISPVNEGKADFTNEELDLFKETFGDKFEIGGKGEVRVRDTKDENLYYSFGKNSKGYWIRGNNINTWASKTFGEKITNQWPLNYNKETREYTFKTFADMFGYFNVFWNKKK